MFKLLIALYRHFFSKESNGIITIYSYTIFLIDL